MSLLHMWLVLDAVSLMSVFCRVIAVHTVHTCRLHELCSVDCNYTAQTEVYTAVCRVQYTAWAVYTAPTLFSLQCTLHYTACTLHFSLGALTRH